MLVSCIWMPLVPKWRLEANIVHTCRSRLVALPDLPDASGEPRDFPEHSSSVPFHFCILRRWGNRLLFIRTVGYRVDACSSARLYAYQPFSVSHPTPWGPLWY